MSPSLYLAHRRGSVVQAMLIIVKGRGAAGLISCRSALLLPAKPFAPVLREFSTPAAAVAGGKADGVHPDALLHQLALKQAAYDTTDAFGPVLPSDFERATWSSLLHWTLSAQVTCEALTMAADYVGSMGGSGQLRTVVRGLKTIHRRSIL